MQHTDIIERARTEAIRRVRHALQHGETPYGLAKKAELHRNTLYGWERDDWNPTFQTLAKLEPHLPAPTPRENAA